MYQTTDPRERGCILFMMAILMLVALIYFSFASIISCGFTPKRNPTVPGVIIKSSIEKSEFERRGYTIEVAYTYTVNDKKYISNTICCGSTANELSKDIIKKYPVDSDVTVYYRGKKPNLSVIEPRFGRTSVVVIFTFSFLFFAIVIGNLYQARKD